MGGKKRFIVGANWLSNHISLLINDEIFIHKAIFGAGLYLVYDVCVGWACSRCYLWIANRQTLSSYEPENFAHNITLRFYALIWVNSFWHSLKMKFPVRSQWKCHEVNEQDVTHVALNPQLEESIASVLSLKISFCGTATGRKFPFFCFHLFCSGRPLKRYG